MQRQNAIEGKWLSEDKEGITEIFRKNEKLFGKIVWLKNSTDQYGHPYTDTQNPVPDLRNQPLMGLVVLKDCFFQNNIWKGGTIYDPETGKTYSCTLWVTADGRLKLRGWLGIFYSTQTWTKVNPL